VVISFLWHDLSFLAEREGLTVSTAGPASPAQVDSHSTAEYERCRLCPKKCGVNRVLHAHPTCGDHQLRVANSGISFGDEPSIRGSGTIMLSGCPLRCPSCHNPEMVASGTPTSVAELVKLMHELAANGANNIQILSPTVHFPALRVALGVIKRERFPLPIVLKSSGYESVEELKKLEGLVDIYLPDLKFGSCSAWGARAGVKDYFSVAREAIDEMIRQVGPLKTGPEGRAIRGVLVRHVLAPIPGPERAEILAFLGSLAEGVGTSVLDTFQVLE
jgi:putative pyruvate formate lyase activating enzyme